MAYAIGDAVINVADGSSYICILGTTGNQPPNATYWSLLASGAPSNTFPLAAGEDTHSRLINNTNGNGLASGAMQVVYFTAQKTEAITKVYMGTGNAQSGGTKQRVGVYSVDPVTCALTGLLAASNHLASLWNSAFQPAGPTGIANLATLSSSFAKVAGVQYALGFLFVGTTGPQLMSALIGSGSGDAGLLPRICGTVTGQADLPGSVAAGSIASASYRAYAALAA